MPASSNLPSRTTTKWKTITHSTATPRSPSMAGMLPTSVRTLSAATAGAGAGFDEVSAALKT
jgi:hypothetical protein